MRQRLLVIVHRAEIELIKPAAARFTFVKMVSLASDGPLTCLQMIFRAVMAALENTPCRVPSG
jgi:hypothetical protein